MVAEGSEKGSGLVVSLWEGAGTRGIAPSIKSRSLVNAIPLCRQPKWPGASPQRMNSGSHARCAAKRASFAAGPLSRKSSTHRSRHGLKRLSMPKGSVSIRRSAKVTLSIGSFSPHPCILRHATLSKHRPDQWCCEFLICPVLLHANCPVVAGDPEDEIRRSPCRIGERYLHASELNISPRIAGYDRHH